MVKHAWSVLCERTIIDKESNNITLSVMEQIKFVHEAKDTGKRLMAPIKGRLVSMWYIEPGDKAKYIEYKIQIKDFQGDTVGEFEGKAEFAGALHARTISVFEALPFPFEGLGHYLFVVELKNKKKWEQVAEVPYLIESVPKNHGQ